MEEATPPTRPMNVEQIVKKAQSYEYNPLIALKYWLRTAGTLLKEVRLPAHVPYPNLSNPLCPT